MANNKTTPFFLFNPKIASNVFSLTYILLASMIDVKNLGLVNTPNISNILVFFYMSWFRLCFNQ